jgi:hypothetical protein
VAKISNVEIPSLLLDDQAGDPSTPAAGFSRIYSKADGLYIIDDAGTVTGPFAESATPGNDLALCHIYRSTDQNVTGSGNLDIISWDTEVEDTDASWAIGTPTQIVIPAALDGRRIVVYGQISWTASTSGNYREARIYSNSDNLCRVQYAEIPTAFNVYEQIQTKPITVATGDLLTLRIRTDTTGIGAIGGENNTYFGFYTVD